MQPIVGDRCLIVGEAARVVDRIGPTGGSIALNVWLAHRHVGPAGA